MLFTFIAYNFMNCSCLVHVINLAMQKLISTYSKSPHFNPQNPDVHVPASCNEVGLVRAIVVKINMIIYSTRTIMLLIAMQERSSAKRKKMWRTIQMKANDGAKPVQLILDMKVRWSSTYFMLDCAERKKEVHSNF
jgi:hypothetical protein